MKRVLLIVLPLLLAAVYYGIPTPGNADGAYFANSGNITIAIDTGSGANDSTRDSGYISTPIPAFRFQTVVAKLKVGESDNNIAGWNGNGDRARLQLITSLGDGQFKILDSINASPPCSLFTRLPVSVIADTLLWKDLRWRWIISDSCSEVADTGKSVMIPWYWEVIVRE